MTRPLPAVQTFSRPKLLPVVSKTTSAPGLFWARRSGKGLEIKKVCRVRVSGETTNRGSPNFGIFSQMIRCSLCFRSWHCSQRRQGCIFSGTCTHKTAHTGRMLLPKGTDHPHAHHFPTATHQTRTCMHAC